MGNKAGGYYGHQGTQHGSSVVRYAVPASQAWPLQQQKVIPTVPASSHSYGLHNLVSHNIKVVRGNRPSTSRRHSMHSPFPHNSHITPPPSTTGVELYGNYRITGPAKIRKLGDGLVVHLSPQGQIDALDGGNCDTLCSETLDCEEDEPCSLIGEHVEVQGGFSMLAFSQEVDPSVMRGVHNLPNKVVLTVSLLPEDTTIILQPGGQLAHPVNIQHV